MGLGIGFDDVVESLGQTGFDAIVVLLEASVGDVHTTQADLHGRGCFVIVERCAVLFGEFVGLVTAGLDAATLGVGKFRLEAAHALSLLSFHLFVGSGLAFGEFHPLFGFIPSGPWSCFAVDWRFLYLPWLFLPLPCR